MLKRYVINLAIVSLTLSSVSSAYASGFSKPVLIGPKAIGMGGAFVGIADDPSAVFHNPAGITQLEGHQIQGGFDALLTDLDYDTPAGTTEKAKDEFIPVPTFGYVSDFAKPVWLGLGVYFPHGNGGEFTGNSIAPFNPNEGRIFSLEIAPAIAWQMIPELSVGATLRAVWVSEELKGGLVPLTPDFTVTDTLTDLDMSGWGFGASVGVLYKPLDFLSYGVTYRSVVEADLDGTVQLATVGNDSVSLEQKLPTLVMTGFGIQPIEYLTVGLQYSWERNSEIKNFTVKGDTLGNIVVPQNWDDSHTIHVGGEYWVMPEQLALRIGYAKDLNHSIPDAALNRVLGDVAAHETSFGVAYKWGRYSFAGTWNARFGDRTIPNNGSNPSPGKIDAINQMISLGVNVGI